MSWELLLASLVLSFIVGCNIKGSISQARWWLTVLGFCITLEVRDYYLVLDKLK